MAFSRPKKGKGRNRKASTSITMAMPSGEGGKGFILSSSPQNCVRVYFPQYAYSHRYWMPLALRESPQHWVMEWPILVAEAKDITGKGTRALNRKRRQEAPSSEY